MIVLVLFTGYLFVLLKVILFKFGSVDIGFLWQQLHHAAKNPSAVLYRVHSGNLTPFKSIESNIHGISSGHNFVNFTGNILIFVPNGLFISLLARHNYFGAFVSSLVISLGLECSQAVFSMGVFDVDDLILNVSGGMLGYAVFQVLKPSLARGSIAGSA
ncbi:hypothetical protein XI25_02175 [Paenibacillus sp. DMB20]|nr:hypothetical protein XI25_02175 [Paenibacillus sp. DMB20]